MQTERSIERATTTLTLAPLQLLAMACVSGGLVGLAARASDYGPRVAHWVGALGAPWLVASFANGVLARTRRAAVIAGALAIIAGVVAYYVSMWRVERRAAVDYAAPMIVGWSLAGVAVGAPFGIAGWMTRQGRGRREALGLAALAGALVAEAIYVSIVWDNPYAQAVALLEVSAAAFVIVTARRGRRVLAYALPLAVVLLILELAVTTTMRDIGWAGL
jgi:hypothetical protein